MNVHLRRLRALCIAGAITSLGWFGSAAAVPVTIDFEGVAPSGGTVVPSTPYVEDGFTITNPTGGAIEGIFDSAFVVNDNGTDIFGFCGTCGSSAVITLAESGGAAFSLLSFDYALLSTGTPLRDMLVTGFFSGGGSISTTVTLGSTWATEALAGFSGLSSATFERVGTGPDLAIDNIVVSVPEPAALVLLSLGLAGLGFRRKTN